ncbi:related to lipase/esterase [Cephalotrichum gorgonifer]|uniref:Related to lipase/esterase n=1 Tax=Cephalotrichum gorgonifer TaxID=2041049 RepID=A0AAE8SQI4_9PEZI|nr:related to lipase/esterase [Cephalotrichum gorgonifer]
MASSLAAIKFILSKIPVLFKTIVFHALSLSPTCHKWTLRTELTVTMLREFITNAPPSTITQQQAMFLTDPGVKGSVWVSKTTFPAPADDGHGPQNLLFKAIHDLKTGTEEFTKPYLQDVEGEWVGYRAGATANTPEPTAMSEREKYENLTRRMNTDATLLYFHGGSYYLMDPVSIRPLVTKYATLANGRVFSVRYRLAPQYPFPAALLDGLVAYLSLLYPPPGAFHEPIPASRIILCGDSAGGNLTSALLQLLLQFHRDTPNGEEPSVMFHGTKVLIPLPRGIALNSPSMDLTRSMHGTEYDAIWDYLPPPSLSPTESPPCAIWPSDPPRADLFCEGSALCHPLVSPLAAPSWAGSPPIFIACGQERLTDECKVFAQEAARSGVPIVWEQYEAMPHCFSTVLGDSVEGQAYFESWATFIQSVTSNPAEMTTKGAFITARTLERTLVDVYSLLDMSEQDVRDSMERGRKVIIDRFSRGKGSKSHSIAP